MTRAATILASRPAFVRVIAVTAGLVALMTAALAQAQAPAAQQRPAARAQTPNPLGLGAANSKEPIKIDADRLDVFDKESRAVFAGNVVAVQGETTVRCSLMTLFYEPRGQNAQGGQPRPAPAAQNPPGQTGQNANDSAIRRIECDGPVTVVSKTQTATGDKAVFDRQANKVIMTGNVALADGPNVTRGERLVYDTVTGVANVETTPGGRVKGLFIPGGAGAPGAAPAAPAPGAAAPGAAAPGTATPPAGGTRPRPATTVN